MKKIFLPFVLSTVMAAILIVACVQKSSSDEFNQSESDRTGLLHNQVLDSVLNQLWKFKIKQFSENNQVDSALTRSVAATESLENFAYQAGMRALANLVPEMPLDEMVAAFPKSRAKTSVLQTRSGNSNEIENSLGAFALKYYNKVVALGEREKSSIKNFLKGMHELEKEIAREAPAKEEAEMMLNITSIARHSAEYWYKNARKWQMVKNAQIIQIVDFIGNREKGRPEISTRDGVVDEHSNMTPGYYPHPQDRSKFYYVTEEGVAILLPCPDGLHFNPVLCVCDWPREVEKVYKDSNGDDIDWWAIALWDLTGAMSGGSYGSAVPGIGTILGTIGGGVACSILGGLAQE